MSWTIRDERPGDAPAIFALTRDAFADPDISNGSEPYVVEALRRDGDLALSLVAEADGELVGHVAFSPLAINADEGGWFALGSISVRRDHRRRGLASSLIRTGLDRLRAEGARGCALIGYPVHYRSSGFASDGRLTYGDAPTEYVQRIVFAGPPPAGELVFAPGFGAGAA